MSDIFHILPLGDEDAHSITEPCACNPDMTRRGENWIATHQEATMPKIKCENHKPVQHRDGKPPWCKKCGLTEGGNKPEWQFGKRPSHD